MRIIKEDQNSLILMNRNILVFVTGIIFVLLGLIIIFQPDFFTSQTSRWYGIIGILLGGYVVFFAKITTVSLDKNSNQLLFLWRNLLGKKIKEYNLDQIKNVELSVAYRSSGKGGSHSYHLAFILNNGEIVPLNPGSSSIVRIMGRQIIPEKAIGTRIASFLDVPFQERRPLTANETLSAVSSAVQNAVEKEMKKQKKL